MTDITPYANSVFEQPWWLETVAPGKWGEVTVEKCGRVIARLPYVLDGGMITMPPMTQTLGIWMDDSLKTFSRGNSQLNHQKNVISELLDKLPRHKSVKVTFDSAVSYILPFRWHGFRIEPGFSYRIKNVKDVEDIDEQIVGKTVQKNVKAAEKVVVVSVDNTVKGMDRLIELTKMTFARQGRKLPMEISLYRRILESSIRHGCGVIMIASDPDGVDHSGAFFLYDEKICYYLIAGQNPNHKNDGSQNLVLRRGIDFAREHSRDFDFEGSMIEGIENFVRQYGGKQVINYTVTRQSILADCVEMLKPRIKRLIGYKI